MKDETICAVVVTYNRKKLLIECLKALKNQTRPVDAIYIVDNASTDGTPELLLENKYLEELPANELKENFEKTIKKDNTIIHYLKMPENTGGAGGFHEGIKRAYKKGYDWIWLMDDDAKPREDALKRLEEAFLKRKVLTLASVVKNSSGIIQINHRGYFDFKNIFPRIQKPIPKKCYQKEVLEIDMASFVGFLVNRTIIKKVGLPKKEFFIHNDDVEFCIRLRKFSRILLVTNSIIFHNEKETTENVRVTYQKLWIKYYSKRNLIWLGKKYSLNKIYFYLLMFKNYLIEIVFILLFDNKKFKRINFLTESYSDGLKGIFDNKKPKRLLYKKE